MAIANERQAAPVPATENLCPYALRNRKMQAVREGESMTIEREVLQGSILGQKHMSAKIILVRSAGKAKTIIGNTDACDDDWMKLGPHLNQVVRQGYTRCWPEADAASEPSDGGKTNPSSLDSPCGTRFAYLAPAGS
jgi:hypothetical protein